MERAVVPKPAVEPQGDEAKGADQFPAGMRVLAVDDDRTCLKVLERLLVCCKYHVTGTTQAETALQMLREKPDGFDLVITDVVMPAIDGFKLLELVGLEMDLPVIMLSGSEDTGMVMKGIMHGACDYLLKPVRILELKNIWQHVVRRRLADQRRSGRNTCADSSVGSISNGDRRAQPLKIRDKAKGNAQSGSAAIHGDKVDKKRSRSRGGQEEEEPEERSAHRKPRFVWAPELHFKFVSAVNQLGIDKAIPRKIQEIMQVENVTREQIASHLQKFRLSLKKVNSARSPRLSIAESFIRRDNFRKYMKLLEGSMDYEPTGSYGNTTTHFEVMSSTTLTPAGAQGTLSSQDTQFADTMRKLTALVEWMNATRLSNGAHGPLSSQDSQFANTMTSLTSLVEQMNLKLAAEGAHGALSSSQSAPFGGASSNHTAFLGRRTNLTLMAGAANGMLPSQAGQFAGMSNNCAATFGWTNSTLVAAGAHGTLPSQTSQFAGASDDLTAIVVSLNSILMSSEDHGTLPSQTSQFTGASNNLTGTWNNNLVMPFEWTNSTLMPAGAHGALGTLPSQPGQFAGTANNFSFLEPMNPMLVPAGTRGDHGTLPPQLSQFADASNHLIDPFNNLGNPQHGNLGGGVYGHGSMVSDPSPPLPPSLVQPPLQPVGFFPTGTPNNYAVNGFAPIAQDSFSPAISSIDFDNSTNVNPVGPPAEFNQPAAGDELQGLVNSFNRSINMHQAGIDESRPMRNFGAELDPMAIEEGGGPTGGMEGNENANANAMCAPDDGTDIFMDWMQDYDLVNDDFDELGKLVGLRIMN